MKTLAPAGAYLAVLAAALVVGNCAGGTDTATSLTAPTTATSSSGSSSVTLTMLPAMYLEFGNGMTVSLDGQNVTLKTSDLPDHNTPYYGVGHAKYEAPQPGMVLAPNSIVTQNLTLRVPASPTSATASDTPLGPMGVAVNGVALFNQYAAGRMPLGAGEIQSFDRYNGHPSPSGQYHYHVEPLWITAAKGSSALIGVLLDGFPVYGTVDTGGGTPTNLDACNGHVGITPHFPQGIYHYHVTSATPYISGCFRGTPGTIG